MNYTNSPLVKYTKLSPNHSGLRNHAIDTITIHCVVGHCSLETLGDIFAPTTRQASSNYGIDDKGQVGMYCEEKNRSWCTSSAANDHRAITIEVASDTTSPYKITDGALQGLIVLCADICKRNGIPKLLWKGDKTLLGQVDKQNLSVHRWYANKSCPGDYIYGKLGYIADEVNKILAGGTTAPVIPPVNPPAVTIPPVTPFASYLVTVTASILHYRKGPGTNYASNGTIRQNEVYTIIAEADGPGAKKWGKLKSGAGWISLDYVKRR